LTKRGIVEVSSFRHESSSLYVRKGGRRRLAGKNHKQPHRREGIVVESNRRKTIKGMTSQWPRWIIKETHVLKEKRGRLGKVKESKTFLSEKNRHRVKNASCEVLDRDSLGLHKERGEETTRERQRQEEGLPRKVRVASITDQKPFPEATPISCRKHCGTLRQKKKDGADSIWSPKGGKGKRRHILPQKGKKRITCYKTSRTNMPPREEVRTFDEGKARR